MPESPVDRQFPAKRILVVEDESPVADSISIVLAAKGHKVDVVEDAKQALDTFETGKYDLVIRDWALGTMTGLDLARVIKGRFPAQPIIMITAYAESLALRKEQLSNIDFLLGKPFSIKQMDAALAAVFSKQ